MTFDFFFFFFFICKYDIEFRHKKFEDLYGS